MERLGLYGGTFAPPHLGHLHAAQAFLAEIPLDHLVIMPTFQPPHKAISGGDTPALRLRMCHATFDGLEKTEVSDFEIQQANVSYTILTLRHLTKPGRRIYMLCGTDMFLTLPTWNHAEEIFRLTDIVCMPRNEKQGAELQQAADMYREKYGGSSVLLQAKPLEVSSTQIRNAIAGRSSLRGLVTPAVERIILEEHLYTESQKNTEAGKKEE